jgi:hypothetical protein
MTEMTNRERGWLVEQLAALSSFYTFGAVVVLRRLSRVLAAFRDSVDSFIESLKNWFHFHSPVATV